MNDPKGSPFKQFNKPLFNQSAASSENDFIKMVKKNQANDKN